MLFYRKLLLLIINAVLNGVSFGVSGVSCKKATITLTSQQINDPVDLSKLKVFSDELSKAQEEVTDTFLDETGPIEETP